jgi:tryptophanase
METMTTKIEPYKTKVVEPIRFTARAEREASLAAVGYNLFGLHSSQVIIDLLTDSGTAAMSAAQWSAMMMGDEAYAGSSSFYRLEAVVKRLTGLDHVIPTHQGRAAEKILFAVTCAKGMIVPNNTHFDTTRANVEYVGGEAIDLLAPEGRDLDSEAPFKGNMDVEALETLIERVGRERIPLVMLTVTNNSNAGHPVSMENVKKTAAVCRRYDIPLFIDACRFAENCYFIRAREPGYGSRSVREIAEEMFREADGCTMSGKKDGLVNIGGFLGLNNDEWATQCRNLLVLIEGFPTYGGMAARDMDALAVGLEEVLDETYLRARIEQVEYLGEGLVRAGVPIMRPTGGHAVYVDARRFLPDIPPEQFPGQSLVCEIYLEAGIRACEIGSVMFGKTDPVTGREIPASQDLVRLAVPRRVFTRNHLDYIAEAFANVAARREAIKGMRIVSQPRFLRHFTCRFEPAAR